MLDVHYISHIAAKVHAMCVMLKFWYYPTDSSASHIGVVATHLGHTS